MIPRNEPNNELKITKNHSIEYYLHIFYEKNKFLKIIKQRNYR